MLTLLYRHEGCCDRSGETYEYQPPLDNGVAFLTTIVCAVSGQELRLVGKET